jgi:alpha-glucosidase/alpha-D-xyloside xylohydrolase
MHYPEDPRAAEVMDQYLWGRDFLVAPIVEKDAQAREVYLPRGRWYDFWTGESIEGSRVVRRAVDLETMPLYVRAGAVVPMGPVRQFAQEAVEGPLTLVVYAGADGEGELYEDDGTTFDHERGAFTRFRCRWSNASRRLTITLVPGSRAAKPRSIEIRLVPDGARRTVTFSGRPLTIRF